MTITTDDIRTLADAATEPVDRLEVRWRLRRLARGFRALSDASGGLSAALERNAAESGFKQPLKEH